jgi:hypothetical protein
VKFIVLLLIIASVVMFAVVMKMPLGTIPSVFLQRQAAAESHPKENPQNTKSVGQDKTRRTTSTTSIRQRRETAGVSSTPAPTIVKPDRAQPQPAVNIRPAGRDLLSREALAIPNSVALYANNSKVDSILRVLSQGTVVEPSMQVIDAHDSWTFVRIPELKIFGFVETSNLVGELPSSGHKSQ